ncbi:mitochondrial fission regulator 2-like isoform X2 [Petromyzon marinus]|uniref:mitochondrial fission regulator 2-like isoform X2 n=1 Tax=Petromyzon marinus TaxID=7757 RepID=UPI003F6EC9A9
MVLRAIEILLDYFAEDADECSVGFVTSGGSSRSLIRRIGSKIQDAPFLSFVFSVLQGRPYGRRRSVVRWIASHLPIPRWLSPHLQLLAGEHPGAPSREESPSVPSFAEVIYFPIVEGVANRCCSRAELRLNAGTSSPRSDTRGMRELPGSASLRERRDGTGDGDGGGAAAGAAAAGAAAAGAGGAAGGADALVKIATLEAELARLRAQIAAIVTAQPGAGGTDATQVAPGPTAPPPPPPPLPPPPSACSILEGGAGALRLIRRRREQRVHAAGGRGGGADGTGSESQAGAAVGKKAVPDMMDVLRNLGKVKLRVVERSPGGRPVHWPLRACITPPSDPAALIAQALRRKFARCRAPRSPEPGLSPGSPHAFSPDVPKFGRHLLRVTGRSLDEPFYEGISSSSTSSSSTSSSSSSSLGSPLFVHS